jgi:hypothetical protein
MTEETKNENNNTNTLSKDEVALINAAFKLYEILILHRCYKRGRGGYHDFTKGAVQAAKKALTGLRVATPGVDPLLVVTHFARQEEVAQAAVKSAIEVTTKAKDELWDNIRSIELSDAERKTLSEEAPIFDMYRKATRLDRAVKELGHPDFASKAVRLVWKLAHRVIHANHRRAELAGAETSNG